MHHYILLTIAFTANAAANILIKAGMRELDGRTGLMDYASNGYLWGGVTSFGVALIFYSLTLAKMPLAIAYPLMTAFGFVIVLLASAFLFGEKLGPMQYGGLALILVGVVLAARG